MNYEDYEVMFVTALKGLQSLGVTDLEFIYSKPVAETGMCDDFVYQIGDIKEVIFETCHYRDIPESLFNGVKE